MKFCVPVRPEAKGGMHTFHKLLLGYFDIHQISYTHDLDEDYDVLFLNSWAANFVPVLQSLRRNREARVVHRIDGSAKDYGRGAYWDLKQSLMNHFSDVTVFQSDYSRRVTSQKYKLVRDSGIVIPNPVDLHLFQPNNEKQMGLRTRLSVVSFSTGALKNNSLVNELARNNPDLEFVLMGRFHGVDDYPNVRPLGHLNREELAKNLALCDMHLQLSLNDAAPNVVTEALACGLPVIYVHSGGTPEIVGMAGLPLNKETFSSDVKALKEKYAKFSLEARNRAEIAHNPTLVFETYMAAISDSTKANRSTATQTISRLVSASARLMMKGKT